MATAAAVNLKELEDDPRLFLYTSLTAGSSHIITATSRMETILKANRIPFQAIDTATDEKARRLWQRRAGQRKLPGLVKEGYVIGDLNEVEEWNEFGELKENIGPVPANNAAPPGGQVGVNVAPPLDVNTTPTGGSTQIRQPLVDVSKAPKPVFDKTKAVALPGAEEIAARAKAATAAAAAATATAIASPPSASDATKPETLTSSPNDKKKSIEIAGEAAAAKVKEQTSSEDALAAGAGSVPEKEVGVASDKAATSDETEASESKKGHVKAAEDEKVESETPAKGENVDKDAAEAVAGLKVDEAEKTQDQDPKEPDAAAKSVED